MVFVLLDADVAAAPKRGGHVLVVLGVRRCRDQLQQSLQEIAQLYSVGRKYCSSES